MSEPATPYEIAVEEFEIFDKEIKHFMETNEEIFDKYRELVEMRNQSLEKATKLLREVVTITRETTVCGQFRVEQSVKGYHADIPALVSKHPEILQDYPELVTGLHIPAVRAVHPDIFLEHPEVIESVDGKKLYQLATDDRINKKVLESVKVEMTTKAFVPKEMVLSAGPAKRRGR